MFEKFTERAVVIITTAQDISINMKHTQIFPEHVLLALLKNNYGITLSFENNSEELKDLCTEAHKYGIKIICDIVFNHMANDGGTKISSEIMKYEPQIFSNQSTYFH